MPVTYPQLAPLDVVPLVDHFVPGDVFELEVHEHRFIVIRLGDEPMPKHVVVSKYSLARFAVGCTTCARMLRDSTPNPRGVATHHLHSHGVTP